MANASYFETTCPQSDDSYPFRDFAPTLAQCYLLVATGYLVARLELLNAADIRGVSAFVGYIGMPGIICMTLADADFGDLRWELVLALFLGKFFVFVLVAGVSLAINGNVGIAGLLAVFCVHTNDLPVGNPLMSSIYEEYRPHMMKYLFLMPAMTMIFFVPVGTFMLEIHKVRRTQEKNSETFKWKHISKKEVLSIFRSLLKSGPVIAASVLGTILNFTFRNKLPAVIHKPFQVIAATVPGCVLSILGFNMVRKERYLITSSVITAAVLLAVKMFITPIVMHTITRLLTDESESSKILSDFALLYGIISPATAVFLSGQEFRKPLAGMSAALILSSFLCFPSSFVVGKFTISPICQLDDYNPLLKKVLFWIASFSVACNLFVAILVFWKEKWRTVPYCYILCLVLTQILTSSGIIVWNIFKDQPWIVYSQIVLYCGGEISEYFWIGIIAVILTTVDSFPSVYHNRVPVISFLILVLFGVFTSVLCLAPYSNGREVYIVGTTHSKFEYFQLMAFTVIQALTISVVTLCLLIHSQRHHSGKFASAKLKIRQGFDNPSFCVDTEDITATHYKKKRSLSVLSVLNEKEEADQYYEEVIHNGGRGEQICSIKQNWTFRLFSLLVLLLITISLKFVSNLYKLFHSNALEIMIPLEFLQSSLFVGQGFFILLTFGIDTRTLSIGMIRWWRKVRYGKEEFLPSSLEIDEESDESIFCNQFRSFYLKSCFQSLAKDRKWKENSYKHCFWGHQLVDWMIQEGVAKDDVEAEELGQKLLGGGVISHVTSAHHFHDAVYLYFFVREGKTAPNRPFIIEDLNN